MGVVRLVLLCALSAACSNADVERFEHRQLHMGTELRVVLYAPSGRIAERAAAAVFRRVAELDSILSDYRADSGLARFEAATEPVRAGGDLFHVVARAIELARLTDGAFDPSVGPVTRLWRDARRTGSPPDSAALESARALIDWRAIAVDSVAVTLELRREGMRLDLGGIAKGYAVDEAMAVLRQFGIERALIVFGGEILAGAAPPGQRGWRIELPSGRELWLENEALATSGDAEQHLEVDGVRISHVVDPRTGVGLSGGAGAVVMAGDALTADALATAAGIVDRATAEAWMKRTRARLIEHRAPVR